MSSSKVGLIFQREYLTRVKKRSFILTTVLTPLAMLLFFVVIGFIMAYESQEEKEIAVLDQAGILEGRGLPSSADGYLHYMIRKGDVEALKEDVRSGKYDGLLVIPEIRNLKDRKQTLYYIGEKQLSIDVSTNIERTLADVIRDYKIDAFGFNKDSLDYLRTSVTLDPQPLEEDDEDVSSAASFIAAGIGGAMGFLMYMVVFIYGMMVMRSVMEEKVSRIVEVMISSVRPFDLMMGKVLGVGAVGLTQLAIWAILIPAVYMIAGLAFGLTGAEMGGGMNSAEMAAAGIDPDDIQGKVSMIMNELSAQNWLLIVPLFLFYFIVGYVLYASLFAAVGSAMSDDLNESQALTLPISIPVIIAFYIMFVTVRSPESSLAVWSSIFPLFSPIVMPSRLAFEPPVWQILLSVVLTSACALFFVWLAGRIYRVGILMYGKKASFKELGKWLFYKD
ncbi:MAG: ABC transporter permease [Saprospiraceae bacterium]|jgi:ABC-2 type transport system permease protein